jgi:hypothetical protein
MQESREFWCDIPPAPETLALAEGDIPMLVETTRIGSIPTDTAVFIEFIPVGLADGDEPERRIVSVPEAYATALLLMAAAWHAETGLVRTDLVMAAQMSLSKEAADNYLKDEATNDD